MEEKIYLICCEHPYDNTEFIGVIVGTEEKAKKWCKTHNAKCKSHYDTVWYKESKILTEDDLRES